MKISETAQLLDFICEAWPRQTKEITEKTVKVWHEMLADKDFDVLKRKVVRHAATSDFPPSIADLRDGQHVPVNIPGRTKDGYVDWDYTDAAHEGGADADDAQ